jgi:hypothetical protein
MMCAIATWRTSVCTWEFDTRIINVLSLPAETFKSSPFHNSEVYIIDMHFK